MKRLIGLPELLLLLGLGLLAGAVWLWAGAAGVLAYAGTVAMVLGLGLAWQEYAGRRDARRAE